jgi:hypothetical protein
MKYFKKFLQYSKLNEKISIIDIEKILKDNGYEGLSVIDKDAPSIFLTAYNNYCMTKSHTKPEVHAKAKKLGIKAVFDKFGK